jgi:hypothetical protein
MDSKRGVSAQGRKTRMMKRPVGTPHTYRPVHTERKVQLDIPRLSIAPTDPDSPSPATNDDILHHETQKRVLSNKLSQISQEFANEDARRRKLEDQVIRARSRLPGTLETNLESEDVKVQLKVLQDELDVVQSKYYENLELLSYFRSQLDRFMKDRLEPAKPIHPEADSSFVEIGKLTDIEKAELANYEKDRERFTKNSSSRRMQSSISSHDASPGKSDRDSQDTDNYCEMLRLTANTLGFSSIPELFAEAESLDRENRELSEWMEQHEKLVGTLMDEIATLEQQYTEVSADADTTEESQKMTLEVIMADIANIQRQSSEITTQKVKDEREFSQIYSDLEEIFDALDGHWENAPDGAKSVTSENVVFVMDLIETTVKALMSEPSQRNSDQV